MDPLYSAESINSYFIEQIKDYAIFATDPEGVITTWNKGAERIKGYKEEEIIGHYYGILFPDEYLQSDKPREELASALEKGSFENEDWRRRKDGSLFWASVTLTPIYDPNGKHIGFTKITGNITKQKELQDKLAARQQNALEHKNRELARTNNDLDTFIYTASHDLRSPITNIEALMSILKDELMETGCFNPETAEVVQRVTDSVHRFKNTLADLTEVSRLQKNFTEDSTDDVLSVKEVYEDIMADLEDQTKKGPCFIKTNFQVNLIRFSKKNFQSILYNLVSNAWKYRSPQRDCIIEIITKLEGSEVVLTVVDNGLGINRRAQKQLFTMFRRFHDHVEGTGIGLFMVKRIVENAGGRIEVESEEGKGAIFKVYLNASM